MIIDYDVVDKDKDWINLNRDMPRKVTEHTLRRTYSKGHKYSEPRPGQFLSLVHNHIIGQCSQGNTALSIHRTDGYAMLMSPSEGETVVHGCHCPGDMAVRMRDVLARP